ncbi:MAG: SdpI family protein [Chloroflexota bacterium]
MKLSKSELAAVVLLFLFFAVALYFYPRMPERMASHWNALGEVDGYTSRFWGVFLVPFISIGLYLFLRLIPKIDPLGRNVEQFQAYYHRFLIVLLLFLLYLYLLTLLWNTGIRFNMLQLLAPAFGILFYCSGVLVEKSKRNWFIGVRTPWTLSSERVWDKTHRLAGFLFKAAGILALLGVIFPRYAILFVLAPALLVALFTVLYSYLEFHREKQG